MTRGIFIAGNESSLFTAAATEAAKRVEAFVQAAVPNRFPIPDGGEPRPKTDTAAGAITLSWNPASPISARTLVLASENRLKQINDAILICSPPAVYKSAETMTPEEIEILVNDHIKGWFYLIREIIQYFRRSGTGSLSLVVPENMIGTKDLWEKDPVNKNSPPDLAGPSASASFRSFAQAVLSSQRDRAFQTLGFTTTEAGAEADFAAWFFKIIDEGSQKNSGRWHKFTKLRFFR